MIKNATNLTNITNITNVTTFLDGNIGMDWRLAFEICLATTSIVLGVFAIHYKHKAEEREMSDFAPYFNLKFDNSYLMFFQVDRPLYNVNLRAIIKNKHGHILPEKEIPLGEMGYNISKKGYVFLFFQDYQRDIADISLIVLKVDYTAKLETYKYRMCFAFKQVDREFRRVDQEFHIVRWLGRLSPRCKIDKWLNEGVIR